MAGRLFSTVHVRDDLVAEEHQLFDERVRALHPRIGRATGHRLGLAVFVQNYFWLRELEVERAAVHTLGAEETGQLGGDLEAVDHRLGGRLYRRKLAVTERARDAAVRQLRLALHEGAVQRRPENHTFRVELHLGAEAETDDVRQERAEVRRERAREHRDGAVRQVHAAAALLGLLADLRAGAHVAAHVGDGDPGAEAAALGSLDPHGVVVIARIVGIDRREREVGEVAPPFQHLDRNLETVGLGLGGRFRRMELRDLREDHRLLDLDPELARSTEHGFERALRVLARELGPARDAHHRDVAVDAAVAGAARIAVDLAHELDARRAPGGRRARATRSFPCGAGCRRRGSRRAR